VSFFKSLLQHEEEKSKLHIDPLKNSGTGIGCPACGEELHETNPGTLLCSNPPRKDVHCKCCKSKYTITA